MRFIDPNFEVVEGSDVQILEIYRRLKDFCNVGQYIFENDSIRHSARSLADAVVTLSTKDGAGMIVHLDDLRVWKNDVDLNICSAFFEKNITGFVGSIPKDGVAIYAHPDEASAISSLLLLSIWFGWTASMTSLGRIKYTEVSHDGILTFFSDKREPWLLDEFNRLCGRELVVQR